MAFTATQPADRSSMEPWKLERIARSQAGLFTTTQALECGISRALLSYWAGRGRVERVATGIYRLEGYPHGGRYEREYLAWLPVGTAKESGVISHERALYLLGLIRHPPAFVYLTFARVARDARAGTAMHRTRRKLLRREIVDVGGLPTTSAARAIVDVIEADTMRDSLGRVVRTALRSGTTTAEGILAEARRRHDGVMRLARRALGQRGPGVAPSLRARSCVVCGQEVGMRGWYCKRCRTARLIQKELGRRHRNQLRTQAKGARALGRRWSAEEDRQLLESRDPLVQLAAGLGRSYYAVVTRRHILRHRQKPSHSEPG
jgi:predicted transcriptional regulator of viral defense system